MRGRCGGVRRWRSGSPAAPRSSRVRPAPVGRARPGGQAGHGGAACASPVPVAVSAPSAHGLQGVAATGGQEVHPPGWWWSVAGRPGPPRLYSAPQPRRAGDGGQRPLVPRSRCPPRLTPGVRLRAAGVRWQASVGGYQGPSTAGVSVVCCHPSGGSVVACRHRVPCPGGWVLRAPRSYTIACRGPSVPRGGVTRPCCMPCATGVREVRHQGVGPRTPAPQGLSGMARCAGVSVPPWHALVTAPWAGAGGGPRGMPQAVGSASVPSAASVPGSRSAHGVASGSRLSVRGRGWEPGTRRWCPSRVRRWWGHTGPCPASLCVCLSRVEGAEAPCRPLHACASTAPMCAGVGGCSTSQHHPVRRLSRVCRGQGHACAPRWPAGGGAPGTGQAGSRGCSGAEQGLAGDWK